MPIHRSNATALRLPAAACALALGALVALVAGCGAKEPTATQTAARVNKDEITVHQIAAALLTPALKPEQVQQAERQILERLINRQLAVQQASEIKLDREPKVLQAIESARQEVIARAYADKLAEGAPRPSAADIKKYYDEHPVLFAERKIYQLQEYVIQADAKQVEALRAALPALRTADELETHLKSAKLKFSTSQSVRAAEQLPLAVLPALARLADGQALVSPTPGGAQIAVLKASRAQPVDEAGAARAIEQFLLNEQKRKLLADDLKALRAAARIEYQGRFAASAPPPAELTLPPTAAEVAASAAGLNRPVVNEAPGAGAAASTGAASQPAGIDPSTVNKGLGLK
jgi:EpsD family peptidyl-prolyl cis-trans isomerase